MFWPSIKMVAPVGLLAMRTDSVLPAPVMIVAHPVENISSVMVIALNMWGRVTEVPLRGDRYAGAGLLLWRLDQWRVYVGRREAAATGSVSEIDDEAADAAAEWDEVAEHPPVAAGFDLDRLVLVTIESQHHRVVVVSG